MHRKNLLSECLFIPTTDFFLFSYFPLFRLSVFFHLCYNHLIPGRRIHPSLLRKLHP